MPPGGPYRGGGGYSGGMFTGGSSHYRLIPPRYMGASRRFEGQADNAGEFWMERWLDSFWETHKTYKLQRKQHKSFIKGTIVAFKGLSLGGLKRESCTVKIKAARKEFEEGKISEAVYQKRCMNANKKYYGYLAKIGFITEEKYIEMMRQAGQTFGVDYQYNGAGRSR
jgi:hypothetical protein